MPKTNSAHFNQIRSWLNEVNRSKSAAAKKKAEAYTETGSIGGPTTHPSKDVDDGVEKAREGARSAENERDVKEMEPAGNVNETGESGPSQDSLNYNIGTRQSATGEDPASEDNYEGHPKDPGTSHPANMSVGPKYGKWVKKEAASLSDLANEILADIATQVVPTQTPAKTASTQQTQTKPTDKVAAAQAGYELASQLGLNKSAADATAKQVISNTINQAQLGADRVGAFLTSFIKESEVLYKEAEGEMPPDPAAMAGGPPPGMDPSAGGQPGGDPTAALAAAAGGAGGPPSVDPSGGAGGPPGGPGGGNEEQALQELTMALMELGISPEELMAAVQQGGAGGAGGGMGGPPGAGGGMPPPGPEGSPADTAAKVASAVKHFKRSGHFEVRPAKTAAERQYRNQLKSYILELVGDR